ncbi:copper chaperone PCu(A)C [Halomonas sp. SpR8]|uniref:copper chaperone PCu(A)C n=1 Tax=Halomonas sp. SpR8 TaxID=3050463 RepID=UPI0027E3F31A|nr:copper chaperone PCu(A)C [Halomonas sp. SpR8]MDQ7729519.1 copper chaperone PCu(A)C [Halomonas sp. SpR8]
MLKVVANAALRLFILTLCAGSVHAAEVEVTDAKLSLLPGDLPSAGYFNLTNTSDAPLVLVGAESASFHMTELHVSTNEDDVAQMHAVEEIEVAPGESFIFAPMGYHLMFMHRTQVLEEGDSVEVVLHFKDQQELQVPFNVVAPGAH